MSKQQLHRQQQNLTGRAAPQQNEVYTKFIYQGMSKMLLKFPYDASVELQQESKAAGILCSKFEVCHMASEHEGVQDLALHMCCVSAQLN